MPISMCRRRAAVVASGALEIRRQLQSQTDCSVRCRNRVSLRGQSVVRFRRTLELHAVDDDELTVGFQVAYKASQVLVLAFHSYADRDSGIKTLPLRICRFVFQVSILAVCGLQWRVSWARSVAQTILA